MKHIAKYIVLLIFGLGWVSEAAGQDGMAIPMDSITAARGVRVDSLLGFKLAPLDTLLERAVANASELRAQDAYIQSRKSALKARNREWMKLFQPIAGVTYGTGQISAAVDDGSNVVYNLSTNQNLVYNVGFTVRFTAEEFLNRKPKAEILEWEIEQLRENRNTQIRLIRERVIMRYEAVMMAAEVMELRADMMETNAVAYELAERYFHRGDLSYADFNGALEAKIYSKSQFVGSRSDFQKNYLLLREVVGGPLH